MRNSARAALWQGTDPIQMRLNVPASSEELIPTFGKVADAYVETHRKTWRNEKHGDQWAMTLKEHCGAIRDKPVNSVSTADVLQVLKPLWQTVPETAARLRGRIENVLDAARALGHIGESVANPARWKGHLDKLLPKRQRLSRGHHPAMPWSEVPAFAASMRRENSISARALEFVILTAARSGEVRLAEIAEFDLDEKIWTVPAERMKAGREHRVPLTSRAIEIVCELRSAFPDAKYVFPGVYTNRPIIDMTLLATCESESSPMSFMGFALPSPIGDAKQPASIEKSLKLLSLMSLGTRRKLHIRAATSSRSDAS